MAIDRKVLREIVADLEKIGPGGNIPDIVLRLKEAGAVRNLHVGRRDLAPASDEAVEWYAGQGLDLLEGEAWFAVNSWINCVDKFCPLKEVAP